MTTVKHLSRPLASMLSVAGMSAAGIDAAITAEVARGLPPLLRPAHPATRRLRDVTGLDVVSLARRYHRLLVEVEEKQDTGIWWIYREFNRASSLFLCGGIVPDTVAAGLAGKPLSILADPPYEIGTALIQTVSIVENNWLSVAVTPQWVAI